mmetsp:Transcript_36025/g.90556  ORF Transcript_36025/g.90556 Transcript_36025/m.90556 type:complete len:155 (+) Transcript_36025:69-533(+)
MSSSWLVVIAGIALSAMVPVSADAGSLRGVVAGLPTADATPPAQVDADPHERRLALPPWWILDGVKPEGEPQDMGGWKAVTFSKKQQEHFGISASGQVKDESKFHAALKALKSGKEETSSPSEQRQPAGEDSSSTTSSSDPVDPTQRNLLVQWA